MAADSGKSPSYIDNMRNSDPQGVNHPDIVSSKGYHSEKRWPLLINHKPDYSTE